MRSINKRANAKTTATIAMVIAVIAVVGFLWMAFGKNAASVNGSGVGDVTTPATKNGNVFYPAGVTADNLGDSATLSIVARDSESLTKAQVATVAYVWKQSFNPADGTYGAETYVGNFSTSASARTSIASAGLVVGDKVKVVAFDTTYDYGDVAEAILQNVNPTIDLSVHAGSATQSVTFFDENNQVMTGTNVTVGTTNYAFDHITVANTDDASLFVPKYIVVSYATPSNISDISIAGANKVSMGIDRLNNVRQVFTWAPGALNDDKNKASTGTVTVKPNGNNVASETTTWYIVDEVQYLTKYNTLAYSYQNDAATPADIGVSDKSSSMLLI